MNRISHCIFSTAVILAAAIPGTMCLAQDAPGVVSITLHEKAVVARRVIQLKDIADIEGGPQALRRHIAEMDVDELASNENRNHACPKSQIQFRLRLAAIPPDFFDLAGANEVMIVLQPQAISPARIEDAAREDLLRRLPWSRDDMSVRLLQPVTVAMPALAEDERLTLDIEPNRSNVGLGHVQMNVAIRVNGEKRLTLPVFFDVQMMQEVAVCRRQIDRGETLTEADLIRQRRPVGPSEARAARPDTLIGKKCRRSMRPGQTVLATDLDESSSGPLLVQPHQPVRMTVHLGSMDVVALGEAMEGGGQGKIIHVRNIDTKAIVTGRVTGPKTVEVESGIR
jgi:flagella basal body P-ring formation protein FlgA